MKHPILHHAAEQELEAAVAYYEQQRQGLGMDFQTEVEQAVRHIQQQPKIFPKYKAQEIRVYTLKRFPYAVFYLELDDAIWIVAIAHRRRKPGYWIRRVTQ